MSGEISSSADQASQKKEKEKSCWSDHPSHPTPSVSIYDQSVYCRDERSFIADGKFLAGWHFE